MKKQQVFYIHGGSSYTQYDDYLHDLEHVPLRTPANEDSVQKWPKTLRAELGEDYEVFMPSMPNAANAKYQEWKLFFEKHLPYVADGIILLGWSLGGAFLTRYVTENTFQHKIKALILVATPYDYFVADDSREDGGDFYPNLERLNHLYQASEIHLMHSKDDFVVPYEHALKYQAALPEATLHTFEDKNHFLVEELPELLDLIRQIAARG